MTFREYLRSWASPFRADALPTDSSPISVTVDELVWFVGKQMLEGEPPFDRNEWHFASVEIPSDWDPVFEMLSHIHVHVVLLGLVEGKFGVERMLDVHDAIRTKWEDAFTPNDPSSFMVRSFLGIVNAEPMSEDDPLLQRPELTQWSEHRWAFGRARAALSLVQLEERHRPEAISGLGRCFIYSRHCAATRFNGMIRRLQFREQPSAESVP